MNAFVDHSRRFDENRYVYPVVSRRSAGLSIGINLSLEQSCNFSCIYCQVDRTQGRPFLPLDLERIDTELRGVVAAYRDGSLWDHARFRDTPGNLRRLNDIAFSGDGEPTREPGFPQVVARVLDILRASSLSGVKVVVITNATEVTDPSVREALKWVMDAGGEVWAKLDAGTEEYYRRVNGGFVSLDQIEQNLRTLAALGEVTIQSLFLRVNGIGPDANEIKAYVDRVKRVAAAGRLSRVQVYTVARRPRDPSVSALPVEELRGIADAIAMMGVRVEFIPPKND